MEQKQTVFQKEKWEQNRTNVLDRLEHTVCRSAAKLFDTAADVLEEIKEEKGSFDYSDSVNAAGYAYARLYAEIEKRYENSAEPYYGPDGTRVTFYEELERLDQEYEAKIAWDQACARTAAQRENFLGNMTGISEEEISGIREDLYESRKKYMDLYKGDRTSLSLQSFGFFRVKSVSWF